MKKIIIMIVIGFLSMLNVNPLLAEDAQSATGHHINSTISHLQIAASAVSGNDYNTAQDHLKMAGQAAKNIIGGSYEVKAQRGSRAITDARRQLNANDASGAADSLTKAIDIFNSLRGPAASGGRGGLN